MKTSVPSGPSKSLTSRHIANSGKAGLGSAARASQTGLPGPRLPESPDPLARQATRAPATRSGRRVIRNPHPWAVVHPPRPALTLSQHRHVAEPVTPRASKPERLRLRCVRLTENLEPQDSHAGRTAAARARTADVSETRPVSNSRGSG